ncbi:MAG: ankyrin repeat domain-containing protein, partial [Myxococcales bacterium]|nr:ankyrin repeat domain-containing protein [Myxococcales bacterium]
MSDAGAKLIAAIEAQDVHATATLLAGGADPNSHDEYDRTALGAATGKARWGDPARGLEILRRLLTAGADPNRVGEHQTPPLIEAAYRGDDEVCRALVEGGADVAARERGGDRHTALLAAASGALPWLLELCLEAGARVDDVSAQGHTVMHYAVSLPSYVEGKAARFEAVAERLRSAGAALEVVNGEWGAPLHWAAGSGNVRGV